MARACRCPRDEVWQAFANLEFRAFEHLAVLREDRAGDI
jgi:hypothetical protein